MKRRLYYKVCDFWNGNYTSFNEFHRLTYKIGETTFPKIESSAIFVFDTIENAKLFRADLVITYPILCGWGPRYHIQNLRFVASFPFTRRANKFWNIIINEKNITWGGVIPLNEAPKGTVLLRSFTPIEELMQ